MALLLSAVFALGSVSAATTGSLLLQGTVPEILEITVNADPAATALDLSVDASSVKVATVIERSNKKSGYTVTVESANGAAQSSNSGLFVNDDPGITDSLSYDISYGGSPVSLTNGAGMISDVSTKTPGTGSSKDVTISYTGSTSFPYEGTYSDTLTFTIAAK
jgi:hypothetical protein